MARPPRMARALLSLVAGPGEREFLLGDFDEAFAARAAREGARSARRWYWQQAVRAIRPLLFAQSIVGRPDTRRDGIMTSLWQDARQAARTLLKTPGYAVVVVLTLALAIGANTVIFSFADVLLLRPLPIRNSERVGFIYNIDPQQASERGPLSLVEFLDYRERARSFSAIAAQAGDSVVMTGRGEPQRLTVRRVTANLLDVWGVDVMLGRALRDGEDSPGAAKVAVLSHGFWARQLGSDPGIVGSPITLDGEPHLVVGVLSNSIEIGNLAETELWLPLTVDRAAPLAALRRLSVSGTVAPGVTVEQADAEIRALARDLARERHEPPGWSAHVLPTRAAITGPDTNIVLAMLSVVVFFVLAIACANLANLTLARASSRTRELAVRAALGASRWRIVRQLVTESLLLSMAGGALALAVAKAGFVAMRAASSNGLFLMVDLDVRLMIFATVLSFVAPVLFSLIPAVRASRADLNETLKEEGTRGTAGRAAGRGRAALVVSQIGLAFSLLVVSGLLLRTMINITRADLGFNPKGLVVTSLEPPAWKYRADADAQRFHGAVLERLEALPGVTAAGAASAVPAVTRESTVRFELPGRAAREEDRPWAARVIVTPGYFRATGVPVLSGRALERRDDERGARVAVVNREAARRYWQNEASAVGQRIVLDGTTVEIVGVVADISNPDVTRAPDPGIFLPLAQHPWRSMSLLVRAAGDPAHVVPALRAAVRSQDSDAAISRIQTLDAILEEEFSANLVLMGLFLGFAAVALALASAGLYGVMSYGVSQRTHEIGIRLALGAVPGEIRHMLVRQAGWLVGIGIALGGLAALVLGRVMGSLLFGIGPADPIVFGSVLALLMAVAAVATWVPARRAMNVDPVRILRA